jgi:hypothetical protein
LGLGDLLIGVAAQFHAARGFHLVVLPVPGTAVGAQGIGGLGEATGLGNHHGVDGAEDLKSDPRQQRLIEPGGEGVRTADAFVGQLDSGLTGIKPGFAAWIQQLDRRLQVKNLGQGIAGQGW